ncbi:16S rRNA (uracil(1498)-N(3))-methyltransferase [Microcella alkaliphila]|uniref:Ribosomal RNA small subunit methyltransferase E n=1 Tax=Microcella alkaliphila TaxID=279828 RepID=A0A0U5BQJ4_9MICO|nr:16S rRNA (uracil(1498)-N(3))-methyltransferase [Microcella alkaliphila]BAU32550.1 ribosomal RNA small subunit methyltransferase E [Microcella alkaliphila]
MAHFYLDETLALASAAAGHEVALTGPDARHAVTVARLRAGETVRVGDGAGTIALGGVRDAAPDRVVLVLESVDAHPEPPTRLTLVQALAKGDRDELAIQAATELGVDAIVPWQAARSVSIWKGPKADKGRARWQTIVREASKQAIRPRVPSVAPIATTRELVAQAGEVDVSVLVLEPTAPDRLSALTPDELGSEVLLVVGPEGGVAPDELAALTTAGARPVRLGDTVLRTSTAGPAALSVLSTTLGRW